MLVSITPTNDLSRTVRRECGLQYDGFLHTPSIGCTSCNDLSICGGLRIKQAVFDCLRFCCKQPETCDAVCRNNPRRFAERVREVGGFDLANVPRSEAVPASSLPASIPMIYHRIGRKGTFTAAETVALPLYKVIGRHGGEPRYRNKRELAAGFGIAETATVILSGSGRDAPLERWWSLGERRRDAIRALRELGVEMVTTPNYSLFTDQPRWDDFHSIKRIGLTHAEFLNEGLLAALHLNARTDKDWARWAAYINSRPEVTHVAFEFATGAGRSSRIGWHGDQLVQLARRVERPLHLVIRGGLRVLSALESAFAAVTVLETTPFMKTMYRQQLKVSADGKSEVNSLSMERHEPLDELLDNNWKVTTELKNVKPDDRGIVK